MIASIEHGISVFDGAAVLPSQRETVAVQGLETIAEAVGLTISEEHLEALRPRVEELWERAARLGQLELRGVEPAFILPLDEGNARLWS